MTNDNGRDYFRASIDTSQFDRDAAHIANRFRDIGNVAEKEGFHIENALRNIGVAFGIKEALSFVKTIVSVRGEMQKYQAVLENSFGSAEKATSSMKMLTSFAATTPFQLNELTDSFVRLVNQGFTPTFEQMTKLGDLSSSTGKSFNQLTEAIIDAQTGEFERLKEFGIRGSKEGDKVTFTFKEQKTQVDFTASAIRDYIIALGDMQGVAGANAKISATLTGQISNLEDNISQMFNEIGEKGEGAISGAISGASLLVENYEAIGKALAVIITTYGTYKAAIITLNAVQRLQTEIALQSALAGRSLTVAQGLQAVAARQLTVAQAALNKTILANPYALAAAAVVALGYGIYKLATYETEAEQAQNRLNDAMRESEKNALSEQRELAKLKGELSATTKGSEEYKRIKDEIVSKYGQYYAGLEGEIERVGFLDTTYQKLTKSIIDSFSARQYTKFAQEETKRLDDTISDNLGKIQDKLYKELGDESGAYITEKIRQSIIDGTELPGEVKFALEKIGEIENARWGGDATEIQRWINDIKKSQEIADEVDKKARVRFGIKETLNDDGNIVNDTTDKFISLSEQIDNSKKKVSDLKKELSDLRSGKTQSNDYAKAIEDKAKELKDAEDRLSYLTTGKSFSTSGKSSGESPAEKARKQAQEIADQNEKLKQIEAKQALERRRQDEDLENQATQARIDAMLSGSEKVRAQQEYDNKLEIQALERQKEDYIQKIIQSEREIFDTQQDIELKKDPKYTKKIFDPSSVKVDTSFFDAIIGDVTTSQLNKGFDAIDKAWNDYYIQFGTYQEKRKAIVEKYDREISEAVTQGEKAILEKQKQNQLDELDNSVKNSATLMGQLFADASKKSVTEIQTIIDKAELLMDYLAAVKDETGNAIINGNTVSGNDILGVGISDNTLKNLELSTEEVEALRNAIEKLKGELGSKSPFKLFENQIGEAIKEIKAGNLDKGIGNIGSAISDFMPAVSQFGEDIGNIFGNDDLGNKISGIADAIGGLGQTASGVGQIMSGDIVGGTISAVSGISSVVSALDGLFGADYTQYNKMREEYDALNEVWDILISKKQEYIDISYGDEARKVGEETLRWLSLKQQSNVTIGKELLNSGASYGSHSIGVRQRKEMSSQGWKELREASKLIGFDYNSVADGRMTGLFDLSAEQLADLQEKAPTFWAELFGETKTYLQGIIDCNDQIEEMKEKLKEAATGVSFDSFYDNFVSTLSDMDKDSQDFADDFGEYLKNAILSNIIANKYRDRIQALYDDWASYSDSDGDGIFDLTTEEAEKLKEAQKALADEMVAERDALADTFDWNSSSDTSQQASSGGYETMSQDTGESLEGRFAALQMSGISIDNTLKGIQITNTESLQQLKNFSIHFQEMRSIGMQSMYYLEDITKNTKELYMINEGIQEIKKNTSRL